MEFNSAPVLLPRWVVMWGVALALYAACKWATYRDARATGGTPDRGRALGYLLFWPGMDAPAFLYGTDPVPCPKPAEWVGAALKTAFGVALIWAGVRVVLPIHPLLAGWVGMTGIMFVLHFGTFHLLSDAWRTVGVDARPVMRNPLRSTSLAEFWGRRWNTAFHELATRFTFRPLLPVAGLVAATLLAFLASGLIHELVISVPARGGYGLPTGYFLLQGLGLLGERARVARRFGLSRGGRGRLFTVVVTAGPAFWLFPPIFVRAVILPMLAAIGAL
jgi:hypothetical protein